jgi:uncharacterized protein (TIGR03083 family)
MSNEWELAGRARLDFADLVEGLDDDQWADETLCPGWTPQHVLGHLVWHTELTVPSLVGAMVRSRFDFAKAADRAASELANRPRVDLIAALRERANNKPSIPGLPETGSVTDTAIHTQDIRRALDLDGTLDPQTVRIGLEFLTTHKNAKYLMETKAISGLQLVASDLDWSYGSGPLIEGPGEAIIMSLTGRSALAELAGDGLAELTERLNH